jgi:hypothetical protein
MPAAVISRGRGAEELFSESEKWLGGPTDMTYDGEAIYDYISSTEPSPTMCLSSDFHS